MTSRVLGRNHLAKKGQKPYRNAVLVLISPTPLITHSTSNKFNKPTRITEFHDFPIIPETTYRKATHPENLGRIYNEHVDTIVRDCSKKSNPDYETWKYDRISS